MKNSLLLAACVVASFWAVQASAATARTPDRGDRVEARMDRTGDRIDRRLDRKGERFDRRWDRPHGR